MRKHYIIFSLLLFASVLSQAQEVLYTQKNKEVEYHYGLIADDDLERVTEIEKIQHEFRTIERTVFKSIDKDYRTTRDITVHVNDYEQSWMTLPARFVYGRNSAILYDKSGAVMRENAYTAEELVRNEEIVTNIRESGFHPGLTSFPRFTNATLQYLQSQGFDASADENGHITTLIYPDGTSEIFNNINLTITREWKDEKGIKNVETSGYEPYNTNQGYLPRIRKRERFIQSLNGPCITEVRMIYFGDYEIHDYNKFIETATKNTESISVFSNPNDGRFSVVVQNREDDPVSETKIVNLFTGQQFTVNEAREKAFAVDMQSSPAGNYVIQVVTGSTTLSAHFIKQ